MESRLPLALAVLLLGDAAPVSAQPSAAFAQVTGTPTPLQSISGRFSSLNPLDRHRCSSRTVSGRVVSPNLIQVEKLDCGRSRPDIALVNVRFDTPADAAQMIAGRRVDIAGNFQWAEEDREPTIVAKFVIAEKARIVSADAAAPPAPAFTSYMICQPPELDALAGRLKSELCVQSTVVADGAAGPALEAAARAPSPDAASGNADAISCKLEGGVSDRHLSAIACAKGSYWAWYKAVHDPQFPLPAPA